MLTKQGNKQMKKIIIGAIAIVSTASILGAIALAKGNTTVEVPANNNQGQTEMKQENEIDKLARKIGATDKENTLNYIGYGGKSGAEYHYGVNRIELYEYDTDKLDDGLKKLNTFGGTEIRRNGNILVIVHNYPGTDAKSVANEIAGKF